MNKISQIVWFVALGMLACYGLTLSWILLAAAVVCVVVAGLTSLVCGAIDGGVKWRWLDGGMYDAINRGFLRANGDILAWLNCDEQYLPGTLEKVAEFFAANPDVDILFGDVVLVDEDGTPISYRQSVTPWVMHVESCFLPTYTAATFVRRKVIDEGVLLRAKYRMISDALWVIDLLKSGYKTAVLHEVLATFVQNGENMGQQAEGQKEWCEWRNQRSGRVKQLFWSVMHRIRKLLLGAYRRRDLTIHIYTDSCDKRMQRVAQVGGRWRKK